ANNLTPWNLVAGSSEAYGTEVLLLAANDISNADFTFTPVKFDMHRIFVEASSINDQTFIIQLWGGTGIFSAATYLTEVPYRAAGSATESVPIDIQMSRQAVANKIWARVKCQSNGQDLDITVGVHAYVG
ncbi:hypothetical protein, partial [Pseudoalteromonas sp.]|uniref:hypothetical protein n=1 Tax=Pseudoalteromonas sp. TaxID=53249 RepID=UPI002625C1F1